VAWVPHMDTKQATKPHLKRGAVPLSVIETGRGRLLDASWLSDFWANVFRRLDARARARLAMLKGASSGDQCGPQRAAWLPNAAAVQGTTMLVQRPRCPTCLIGLQPCGRSQPCPTSPVVVHPIIQAPTQRCLLAAVLHPQPSTRGNSQARDTPR
jgi:hypothetical protein